MTLPRDRGWAFAIAISYFFSCFIMVGTAKSFGVIMLAIKEKFDTDTATASLGMSIGGIFYTFIAPFALLLGEHFTQRRVVIIGSICGSVLICLSSLTYNVGYVVFMYGLGAGISNACLFGNGLVMIGHYFLKYRSVATGLALSGSSIGTFALPPILQLCLDTYGLNGTLLLIGGLYLNVCVCGALYRPFYFYEKKKNVENAIEKSEADKLNHYDKAEEGDGLLAIEGNGMRKDRFTSTGSIMMGSMESLHAEAYLQEKREQVKTENKSRDFFRFFIEKIFPFVVLKIPVVIYFTVLSFFIFFGYFNFVVFMPADLKTRGITGYEKAWLVSISGIGDLIGRVSSGILGNLEYIERYKIVAFCCTFGGIQVLVFAFASEYWWMAIHVALYGFLGGGFVALNVLVVIDIVGLKLMPKVLGVVLFIQGIGAAIGQPIEGSMSDAAKSFIPVNLLNGGCMLLGGILLFMYPLIRDRSNPREGELEETVEVQNPTDDDK